MGDRICYLKDIEKLAQFLSKKEELFSDKKRWYQFWVSIDTIKDTYEAINFYKSLDNFNAFNGGYLYIYGVLQALFLQQDALKHLSKSLLEVELLIDKNNYKDLFLIRQIRNSSIGHPTNKNQGTSFHFISRPTINKYGFVLINEYKVSSGKKSSIDVEILKLIDIQEKLICKILGDIKNKLETEIEKHREKFKGQFISDLFSDTLFNALVILRSFENYPNRYLFEYEFIFNTYKKIKQEFIERLVNLNYNEDLKIIFSEMDSIFDRLNLLIEKNIDDKLSFILYLENLENRFNILKEFAIEIDNEYV